MIFFVASRIHSWNINASYITGMNFKFRVIKDCVILCILWTFYTYFYIFMSRRNSLFILYNARNVSFYNTFYELCFIYFQKPVYSLFLKNIQVSYFMWNIVNTTRSVENTQLFSQCSTCTVIIFETSNAKLGIIWIQVTVTVSFYPDVAKHYKVSLSRKSSGKWSNTYNYKNMINWFKYF